MLASWWWLLFVTGLVLVCWAVGGCRRLAALRRNVAAAWAPVDGALDRRHALAMNLFDALRANPRVDPRLLDAAESAAAQLAATRLGPDGIRVPPRAMTALDGAAHVFERIVFRLFAALDRGSDAEVRAPRTPEADASPDAAWDAAAAAMQGWRDSEPSLVEARGAFNAAVDRYNRAAAEAPTWVLSRLFGFAPAARW
jgi:hypothetical protein